MTLKEIRRKNLRILARRCGGITQLARRIDRKQPQISHLIGTHTIRGLGDKLANHIEETFDLPFGWLDREIVNVDDIYFE